MERNEYEVMAAVELNHWWYGGMRALNAALLNPLYQGQSNLRILDAGCGTAADATFLRRYGQVVGLDYSADAVRLGNTRLPGWLTRGSVLELPFASQSFDLVTSFDVLYHRAVPDEAPALAEMRRVLRPGGRLLLRLPAYQFLLSHHDRQVHTRRRYLASEVQEIVEQAGFQVERISYVLSLLFPIPLTQRLLERITPEKDETSAMETPSSLVNTALRWPMAFEAAWLSMGGNFPFGLSILCLAQTRPDS